MYIFEYMWARFEFYPGDFLPKLRKAFICCAWNHRFLFYDLAREIHRPPHTIPPDGMLNFMSKVDINAWKLQETEYSMVFGIVEFIFNIARTIRYHPTLAMPSQTQLKSKICIKFSILCFLLIVFEKNFGATLLTYYSIKFEILNRQRRQICLQLFIQLINSSAFCRN